MKTKYGWYLVGGGGRGRVQESNTDQELFAWQALEYTVELSGNIFHFESNRIVYTIFSSAIFRRNWCVSTAHK